MSRFVLLLGTALLACTLLDARQTAGAADNVPQFLAGRMPAENGPLPPEKWSASENVIWKSDVPGLAWSSPIVWGNQVILTTCVNTGVTSEPRKGLYLEDVDANKYPKPKDVHEWKVLCLDLNSGKKLWEHTAHAAIPAKPHHIKNTLASETPTTDGERIYAYFGNVGLFVYDMNGKPLWSKLIPPKETRYGWGTGTSPILHEDRVYIVNDNEEQSYLMALDKKTGDEKLRFDREDEKTNYSTPFVWKNDVRTELVTSGIGWARSYDLDGKLLWKIKGKSILAIPTPFAYEGLLYLIAGHVVWGENPMYAIKPGATGDISTTEAATTNDYVAWSNQKTGPYHPTPIIYKDKFKIDYDSEVTMITRLGEVPLVLAATNKDFAPKSYAEFIALAKAQPGKVRYASVGVGSNNHYDTEALAQWAGIKLLHIPNKGGGAAITNDLVNGDAHVALVNAASSAGVIKAGLVRVLAVMADARLPEYPDAPTLKELGYPEGKGLWSALYAPAKTPPEVLDTLHRATVQALRSEPVQTAFSRQMIKAVPNSSIADAKAWNTIEAAHWRKITETVKVERPE